MTYCHTVNEMADDSWNATAWDLVYKSPDCSTNATQN